MPHNYVRCAFVLVLVASNAVALRLSLLERLAGPPRPGRLTS